MGKKSKGKNKQWRKIDTQDVDDYIEKSTREAQQGLVVDAIPDADLFFVDTAPDDGVAASVAAGVLPRKLHHRSRLTRAQAIIQAAHSAHPVSKPQLGKKRRGGEAAKAPNLNNPRTKPAPQLAEARDLWAEGAAPLPVLTTITSKMMVSHPALRDTRGAASGPVSKRHKMAAPLAAVRAVTVDPPGCSFNPEREVHQDAIAEAVAVELKRQQQKDLAPTAPLRLVNRAVGADEEDELAMLQVEEGSDDEEEAAGAGRSRFDGSDGSDAEGAVVKQAVLEKRKTQKDRNREARGRAVTEELALRKREKAQRRDLEALPALKAEMEEEAAAKGARLARRHADMAEKRATEPPRLGKHKFEALPLQVLTTDEVCGSLRRLRPTPILATERFKSLQRRGIIEPRRKVNVKVGKKKSFIRGEQQDRAEERHAELEGLKQERQKASKAAKKAARK